MKTQRVGYVRVSTHDQNPARQLEGVELDRTFTEFASGKSLHRPVLKECLAYVREGDQLHVHAMDRLARNLDDLRKTVTELTGRGVTIFFHSESMTFAPNDRSPLGLLLLSVMGAFAEFERNILRERQREGIAVAKAAGKFKGRRKHLTPERAETLRRLVQFEQMPIAEAARKFGCSPKTVRRYLMETP
jgi:DNA invertase Pin-like site-specific DNA recombinase